jgi:GTP-binding protein Era
VSDIADENDPRAEIAKHGAKAWEDSEEKLRLSLAQHLTVAFLGSASAGKDSAIRALFGIDFGDISPIPGSTDRLRVSPLDPAGQVLVVNAPGFGDIRSEVDAVARKVLDSLDIVVYVVNSEGGATIDEKNDLAAIRSLGKPVLVALNKIDLIRPAQRDTFVAATLVQLGVDKKDAVVCAFDPLPQLSEEPLGVQQVVAWIYEQLEKSGKDLLFAKSMRNKALACEPIIQSAARTASLAGAVPIPGADLAAVTAIQVKLIRDLAVVFEVPVDRDLAIFLVGEILSGSMKGFVRWGVQALKAAGWIPGTQIAEGAILALGALIAGATTYGVGHAAVRWFQSGNKLSGDELRVLFDAAAWKYKDQTQK